MSNGGRWRLAFVGGLFASALVGTAVYGATILLAIGVLAALTPVVNGILGASDDKRPYLGRVIRSALSAGWFFRVVTVGLWIGAIATGATAFRQRLRPARQIEIAGRVYAANGMPASYARVEIAPGTDGAICGQDGAFAFTAAIDRNTVNFMIRARRGGYHSDEVVRIDGSNPQQRVVVTLTLPKETPPFRILYVYLKGRAVDLFLDPPRREVWDGALQSGSFTVRNDVLETLREVAGRFSAPARHSVFYVNAGAGLGLGQATERLANDPPERPAFAGSNGENNANGFDQHVDIPVSSADVHPLLVSHSTWAVLQRPQQETYDNQPLAETVLLFRRSCDRGDLARFADRSLLARFYAHLADGNVPPDFAWLDLSIDYSACGDQKSAQLTLTGRLMVMEVAVMENITNNAIEVGPFNFHQSTITALRIADDAAADRPQSQRASWFSPTVLRPGERILIPTRLLLEFAPAEPFSHTMSNYPRVADPSALTPEMLAPFNATAQDIAPLLANAPPSLELRYIWGPSITLDDVQIEGLAYPIRAAASRSMLVLSGNEIGSCPYFSGYSPATGWVSGGTILTGRSSQGRAGMDRRSLPTFDGRVLLEEREREQTFIADLAVEVVTDDGRTHLLRPSTAMPLRLAFGDRLEVSFRNMPARPISRATLIATGYYIPH